MCCDYLPDPFSPLGFLNLRCSTVKRLARPISNACSPVTSISLKVESSIEPIRIAGGSCRSFENSFFPVQMIRAAIPDTALPTRDTPSQNKSCTWLGKRFGPTRIMAAPPKPSVASANPSRSPLSPIFRPKVCRRNGRVVRDRHNRESLTMGVSVGEEISTSFDSSKPQVWLGQFRRQQRDQISLRDLARPRLHGAASGPLATVAAMRAGAYLSHLSASRFRFHVQL